jgi:phage recombination protein Bet
MPHNPTPVRTMALTEAPAIAPLVTVDQLALIKKTIAKDATDAELELFLYDNARRGVHPLDRLIHFSKRSGRYTPITSIDFMRSRAAQTGDYAGNDDATFTGAIRSEQWAATVTVYRFVHEQKCLFTATARWPEYRPAENDFMYKKMPHTMLAKCAEALALRKGFPQELSGLYAAEEMAQAGSVDMTTGEIAEAPTPPEQRTIADGHGKDLLITKDQAKRFHTLATKAGWQVDDLKTWLKDMWAITSSRDIPNKKYDAICDAVERGPKNPALLP